MLEEEEEEEAAKAKAAAEAVRFPRIPLSSYSRARHKAMWLPFFRACAHIVTMSPCNNRRVRRWRTLLGTTTA